MHKLELQLAITETKQPQQATIRNAVTKLDLVLEYVKKDSMIKHDGLTNLQDMEFLIITFFMVNNYLIFTVVWSTQSNSE